MSLMADQDLIIRDDKHAAQALPSNIEAEAAFLGAVLFDNRVLEELPVALQPQHFFESIHQKIFERILQLIDRNATASPVSLKPYFEGDEALADLGGTSYLMQLSGTGLGTLAARELSQQIYDLALLRVQRFGDV